MTNYGFQSTDDVQYDSLGFPLGRYRFRIAEEEGVPSGVKIKGEILSGERKGSTFSAYFNTVSDNAITAKIAQQDLKRIADATGLKVDQHSPLQGRVLCAEVIPAKDERYTKVQKFMHQGEIAEEGPF